MTRLRIGQGFDVHAFVPGRPLRLGGVDIAHGHGLIGHSDGDALLHAVVDALLGATGRGDIGQRFPSIDSRFLGVDSRLFVQEVLTELRSEGWSVVNLDVTVIAQAPQLTPYAAAIRSSLADLLRVEPDVVGLKAKTTDHLGAVGRNEGLAVLAVVLLERA